MSSSERKNILYALNIDASSLVPKTEQEFRAENDNAEQASALWRYHQQRLLLNFNKLRDFLKKTQKRRGQGNCIYLSKEGSRLLEKGFGLSRSPLRSSF